MKMSGACRLFFPSTSQRRPSGFVDGTLTLTRTQPDRGLAVVLRGLAVRLDAGLLFFWRFGLALRVKAPPPCLLAANAVPTGKSPWPGRPDRITAAETAATANGFRNFTPPNELSQCEGFSLSTGYRLTPHSLVAMARPCQAKEVRRIAMIPMPASATPDTSRYCSDPIV